MTYRPIEEAPENVEVRVVWGLKHSLEYKKTQPEYGRSIRSRDQWYMKGDRNPHANGKPCAAPDGWLPMKRGEWTAAERRLCEILTCRPDLSESFLEA